MTAEASRHRMAGIWRIFYYRWRIWSFFLGVTVFPGFLGCTSIPPEPEVPVGSYGELVDRALLMPEGTRQSFWNLHFPRLRAQGLVIPEIRGTEVLFLFEAPGCARATLYGDLDRWASPGAEMIPIRGTGVFYLRRTAEPQSRLKYRFFPDARDVRAVADPWNPRTETTGRRTDSLLVMPDYSYPETAVYPEVPMGRLAAVSGPEPWFRNPSGRERQVWFYESPQGPRKSTGPRPLIIFGDGKETVEISRLPVILDNLVASGELEPVCALFIAPLNRDGEYLGRDRKSNLEFLRDVLVPRLEEEEGRVRPLGGSPDRRVMVGASNGGEFVLWAGSAYPEFSTRIFNQSGVAGNEATQRWLNLGPGSRIYSLVGGYERDFNLKGAESLHRALNRNAGITHRMVTLPQGHTWRLWGDGFRAGILWLLYGVEDPGVFSFPAAAPEEISPLPVQE